MTVRVFLLDFLPVSFSGATGLKSTDDALPFLSEGTSVELACKFFELPSVLLEDVGPNPELKILLRPSLSMLDLPFLWPFRIDEAEFWLPESLSFSCCAEARGVWGGEETLTTNESPVASGVPLESLVRDALVGVCFGGVCFVGVTFDEEIFGVEEER